MSESDIKAVQDEIVEDFSLFDDWMDRYRFLIDLGRGFSGGPGAFGSRSPIRPLQPRRPWADWSAPQCFETQ